MDDINAWLPGNYIEIFGAITGVIYVLLEIRQNIWLWPVGIITSAVYIWVFFASKFYADMSLQGYYLIISCIGWYWWNMGSGHLAHEAKRSPAEREGTSKNKKEEVKGRKGEGESPVLHVTLLKKRTGIALGVVFIILYAMMWVVLSRLTDSPVPGWDSFITSLSIIATWMLARKIYEHWYLWIIVNFVSAVIFMVKGLYPTVILYLVYGIMSFSGLVVWRKTIKNELPVSEL